MGLASATPPAWVSSSSAAETWALYLTLQEVAVVPKIVTDCMGLVNAVRRGCQAATSPKMADARVWKLISHILDGQMGPLRDSLTWMPAHTSVDQFRHRRKSDLKRVSAVDWRANQLADALAKSAAIEDPGRTAAAKYLHTAKQALVFHASVLGVTAHAANNHQASREKDGGGFQVVTLRDSTSLPKAVAGRPGKQRSVVGIKRTHAPFPPPSASWLSYKAQALVNEHSRSAQSAADKRARALAARRIETARLAETISRTAAALVTPAGQPSAAERMSALRARISAKQRTDGGK